MRQVAGPEDVSKRDLIIGVACVAVLFAVAIVWFVMIGAPSAQGV